jgi:hypothetical protein
MRTHRTHNPFTLVFGLSAVGGFIALFVLVLLPAAQRIIEVGNAMSTLIP